MTCNWKPRILAGIVWNLVEASLKAERTNNSQDFKCTSQLPDQTYLLAIKLQVLKNHTIKAIGLWYL